MMSELTISTRDDMLMEKKFKSTCQNAVLNLLYRLVGKPKLTTILAIPETLTPGWSTCYRSRLVWEATIRLLRLIFGVQRQRHLCSPHFSFLHYSIVISPVCQEIMYSLS